MPSRSREPSGAPGSASGSSRDSARTSARAPERAASSVSLRFAPRAWLALGALLFALAALLWSPAWSAAARGRELCVVLVDMSASTVRTRSSWPAWRAEQLREEAREAERLAADFCVVAYAEGVEVGFGPRPADEFELAANFGRSVGERESDLARALVALRAIAGERRVARLCVLGDGEFSGAEPTPELAKWREAGAQLALRQAPAPDLVDLALDKLRAPRELEAGAPLAVSLRASSLAARLPAEAFVRVTLEVRDRAGARDVVHDVPRAEFEARGGAFALDLGPLAEGLTDVRATLQVRGALDASPENDSRAVRVRSRGALVVGALTNRAEEFRAWLDACRALPGLDVRAVSIEGFEAQLEECDALVALDVDPRELNAPLVRDFVRRGGGFLAAGGVSLLGGLSAGRADSDLAALLPLTPEQGPSRDVVLLLDGSGSMQGAALDELRHACLELARHAAPNERVQAFWFTDALLESFELERGVDAGARAANLERWARARRPGGPTDIVRVLGELARRRAGELPALALLVSDGRDQRARGASADELAERVRELERAGVRLAVVSAGADADRAWLDELARTTARGRAWSAEESGLAEALSSETARERVTLDGGAVRVLEARADDEPEVVDLREALARAVLPAAGAHWRAQAREGDRIVLALDGGAPLLALRRFGAGWGATWTSAPCEAWSPAWSSAASALAPVLRTLARGGAEALRNGSDAPRSELRAEYEPFANLVVLGCPLDWPAQVGLAARDGAERALASVPHDRNALDPRSVRVVGSAELPSDLRSALESAALERLVVTDSAGRELARVRLEREPAAEFRGVRAKFQLAEFDRPPGPGRAPGSGGPEFAADLAPAQRTWGLLAALAGAAALAWGLVLSSGPRRGPTGQVLPASRR